ncbi:unnamed protein product [Phytophthora fragariaefolia]|uniref:Unnamed protein product n=1 Tax=Phytophthora fragariaefolia TaxID=1490495 RepID=A0A9W6XWA9_9STRA|nr:unnamed protein product [Phytophthora fragariaefolia]
MKIFGDETESLGAPLPASVPGRGKRRARSSSSSVRANQAAVNVLSEDSDGAIRPKRERHRRRRRSSENKVGTSAQNPIALLSDSSGDEPASEDTGVTADSDSSAEEEEWAEGDTRGGFDEEEETAGSSYSSSLSSQEDTNDEPEDEDIEIATNAKKAVKPGKRRSHSQTRTHVNRKTTDKTEGNIELEITAKAEAKTETDHHHGAAKWLDGDDNDDDSPTKIRPRPLLKTSHSRSAMHRANMKHKKHPRSRSDGSVQHVPGVDKHRGIKRTTGLAQSKHNRLQNRIGKKAKSAPRSLLENLHSDTYDGRWDDNDDNGFNLGVEQYGESPPRRPPSRVHSRANSVKSGQSSPATSIIATSPMLEFSDEQKEEPPVDQFTQETINTLPVPAQPSAALSEQSVPATVSAGPTAVSAPAPAISESAVPAAAPPPPTSVPPVAAISSSSVLAMAKPAAVTATTPSLPSLPSNLSARGLGSAASTPSCSVKSSADSTDSSAQVSMELTQVVLPPDNNKYHIRVTVSADKPPVYTIWMENLTSREQREYSFTDVLDLPGANTEVRVPTATVLTALFRCLISQPDAVVIVGPEPKATAESKTAFEKGEVLLQTSRAEKQPGIADGDGDGLTLVVAYPALDLFRVDHHFPMKLVSTNERLQHLAKEVERLREQLHLVQTDRDKLCEQLRQQEEENERALSQQVEAQVQARMAAQNAILQGQQQIKEKPNQQVDELAEKKIEALKQSLTKEKCDRSRAMRWVFARSDWMTAFHPCQALMAGATSDTETSLLRPATAASPRKYIVEWKELLDIAEPFFQPSKSDSGFTLAITVVKDGMYQVNASVSHDSVAQLRLVVAPRSGAPREIAPTTVLLYDNKQRVSRVDLMLYLRGMDRLSLELELLNSPTHAQQEQWLRVPMPTHNRLFIAILDEHAAHPSDGVEAAGNASTRVSV